MTVGLRSVWLGWVPGLILFSVSLHAQEAQKTEFELRIQASIDKGVSYLYEMMEEQRIPQDRIPEVYPLGIRALPAYALLESGTSANAPRIRRLFKEMERIPLNRVYSVSIYAMALVALHRRARENEKNPRRRVKMENAHKKRLKKLVSWIEKVRSRPRGIWGYDNVSDSNPWDVWLDFSNTQFAVLALQVGLANEVKVSDDVLEEIVMSHSKNAVKRTDGEAKLYCQGGGWWTDSGKSPEGRGHTRVSRGAVSLETGGFAIRTSAYEWPYRPHWGKADLQGQPGRFTRYAMQAAATSSLMVAREGLAARGKLSDSDLQRIDDLIAGGVLSLHKGFHTLAPAVVGSLFSNYYYDLYSFEKAMDLGGIETLGNIDWYREQSLVLMAAQREDGAWGSGRRNDQVYDVVSTSFALLFLNRATQNLRVTPAQPILTGGGADQSSGVEQGLVFLPSKNGMVALDELFARLASSRTVEYLDLAREVVEAVPPDQIPELLPYLAAARNDSRDSVDRFCREQILAISGLTTSDEATVEAWVDEWRRIRRWGAERDASRVDEIARVLLADATTDPLRITCVTVLTRIASLDGVPALLNALQADSTQVRARAAGALERITLHSEPFDPESPDPAAAAGLWRDFWAREEEGLRFRLVWDRLRDQLESARDERERARLREEIVALGEIALPRIEEILARGRYAFDWVIIQERITGTRRGL